MCGMRKYVFQDEILSTAYLAAKYLKRINFNQKVYVVGGVGIFKELDLVGIRYTDDIGVSTHE